MIIVTFFSYILLPHCLCGEDGLISKNYDNYTMIYHPITQGEIEYMKEISHNYYENQNYNTTYDGYCTGESPTSEEEFNNMLETVRVVDDICILDNKTYLSSVDHSTSPYFPKIGNQVGPSCAAWATTYYQNGYYQARDKNWTQASNGYNDQLMSPAWTYNKVLSGPLNYSSFESNWNVIRKIGCSKESLIPSDVPDYINWGSEDSWRCAPEFRCSDYYYWLDLSDITNLKNALIAGYVPYISIHADIYYLGLGEGDDTVTSNELVYGSNHANTIVGFDDNKISDGEIGAFKIANSWGQTWGWSWGGCGYYWITYDAFIDLANAGHPGVKWFDDLQNYKPNLIGTWELDPQCSRDAAIELGIGPHENPVDIKSPYWCCNNLENFLFPSFMCLDITEFFNEWESNVSDFYLEIDDATIDNGVISSFKIEYYNASYLPGNPNISSAESPDTPLLLPGYATVNFQLISESDFLYVTSLLDRWNFVSLPINNTINKENIIIKYNETYYNWSQATTNDNPTGEPILLQFLYSWDRINQTYNFSDNFLPGYSHWIYVNYNCELWIEGCGNIFDDNFITDLHTKWNIVSLPFNESIGKEDILVYYNGGYYNWIQATTDDNPTGEPIILSFIYTWNKQNQNYNSINNLFPGDGYWIYAFNNCKLLH